MKGILAGVSRPTERVSAGSATMTVDMAISLAAGIAIFLWFRGAPVNHDVAWYLVAGRQWIEGAQLYTDLSEVNPPLAFYLTRGALHLGDLFALDPTASLALYVAVLTTLSLIWSMRLVPVDLPHRTLFLVSLAGATTLPFTGDFGQREHLMLLLILPWVTAALCLERPYSGLGGILRGCVAGVGICLKPYFLVYPVALSLHDCVRQRSMRPLFRAGHLAMGAIGAGYVIAVAFFHPEYFTFIVPDARLVYGAYTLPFEYFVQNIWPVTTALIAVVFALGWRRAGDGGARAALLFLAGLAAYALQGNGFAYHATPARALALIGLALIAVRARPAIAVSATMVATLLLTWIVSTSGYRNPLSSGLKAQFEAQGLYPDRLLVWSPSLLPSFPLVLDAKADWAGHAASLWLLPGTLDLVEEQGAADDPRQIVLTRARQQMARDLATCPDVLVLDRVLPFRERPLDTLAFAGETTASLVRRNYALLASDPRFDIMTRTTPCSG